MNRRTLAAILFALACWLAPGFSYAQVLDATVERELPSAKQLHFAYHLWPTGWHKHWREAFAAVMDGRDVVLNIEPDVSTVDPMPVDPKFASLDAIRQTHARIAVQLEPLCELAKSTGSAVSTYRLLSPTHARAEDIVNDPAKWQEHVQQVVTLEYAPGKTIAKLLHSTGGGEVCECYVGAGWNVNRPWAQAKCTLLVERQQATLEALGIRSIPLLHPFEIGGKGGPLRDDVWQAMVFAAQRRGRFAVWNGPHKKESGEAWFKPMPESLKGAVR